MELLKQVLQLLVILVDALVLGDGFDDFGKDLGGELGEDFTLRLRLPLRLDPRMVELVSCL